MLGVVGCTLGQRTAITVLTRVLLVRVMCRLTTGIFAEDRPFGIFVIGSLYHAVSYVIAGAMFANAAGAASV